MVLEGTAEKLATDIAGLLKEEFIDRFGVQLKRSGPVKSGSYAEFELKFTASQYINHSKVIALIEDALAKKSIQAKPDAGSVSMFYIKIRGERVGFIVVTNTTDWPKRELFITVNIKRR